VLLKSGKRVGGRLQVESTGIEFKCRADCTGIDRIESSFIIYKSKYPSIDPTIRYLDELARTNVWRREKTLRHSCKPGLMRRMPCNPQRPEYVPRRPSRHHGHAAFPGEGPGASTQAQQRVSKPGLEVLEVNFPGAGIIEVGVFRDYSPGFLEVMTIRFPEGVRTRGSTWSPACPRVHPLQRPARRPDENLDLDRPGLDQACAIAPPST